MWEKHPEEELHEEAIQKDKSSKDRYDICKLCDSFNQFKFCQVCGCFMPLKVMIPLATCPKNKW